MRATSIERDRAGRAGVRALADQAFSRASGAQLREGNCVRLLKDAGENYPAWLDAIAAARRTIHVEMYIIHEDEQGRRFADALLAKAREGVRVRVIYDWLGGFRNASRGFWHRLRAGGIEVRCYNPPHFDQPLGWLSRDHRKLICIDGEIGFVTGLCIGEMWVGYPARGIEPWRDTGVEIRGPAVIDIEAAFADAWASIGDPIADDQSMEGPQPEHARSGSGFLLNVGLRIVATVPDTASVFRLDLLVAALARETLWLTDAYYSGTAPYVQALRAAALDGVDVRLLVPGSSDVPIVTPFSRAGYRPLLEAGVRVFEWNGPMLHAKTAAADAQWARVGSTNLNLTSWIGNLELDAVIEDARFARRMQEMYENDLGHATEIVLWGNRVRRQTRRQTRHGSVPGSSGRAMAGALRIGNTMAAAVTNRRVLEPIEGHIALIGGASLFAVATLAVIFPRGFTYPFAVLAAWMASALLVRGVRLLRARRRRTRQQEET